jgi:hypothetical protein
LARSLVALMFVTSCVRSVSTATPTPTTGLVISPYAKSGYIDHQTLSQDAYVKFIGDDFLAGARIDPKTDGRPDSRPDVRENSPQLGDLAADFNFRPAAAPAADPRSDAQSGACRVDLSRAERACSPIIGP